MGIAVAVAVAVAVGAAVVYTSQQHPQAMHTMLRPGLVILKEHRHKSTLTFVQVVIQSACSVSQKLCCKINSNFLPRARGQVAGGLAGRLVNCI